MISRDFLREIADAAAAETLPRFRASVMVDNKRAQGFDPVTEADRRAEKAIQTVISKAYPDHGFLGEEYGALRGDSRHIWVVDPIDGTRAFISGLPLWGTLVGLTIDGDATAGMMSQPFTGEFFYTIGKGAFYEGPGGERALRARETQALAEATLCTTTPALFTSEKRPLYDAVERAVRLPRYGTDCYAYAMLAAGQVDLVVEAELNPYDIVAMIPIIEQAGGVITNWRGGAAEAGGDIVAAATPRLHEATLELLNAG